MSTRRFSSLAVLIINLSGMAGWGEGRLTLDQAISEGLGESPQVVQADAMHKQATFQTTTGLTDLLPRVSLFATHSFATQYETLPFTAGPISADVPIAFPRTSFGLEMHWTLFDGFANWDHYDALKLNERATAAIKSREQFEVRKHVELQFYAVLAAIELQEVATRNLKTIQDNLVIARSRVRNGVSTEPDVLRVEVQRTEAEAEVQRTADAIIIQRQKLRETMGLANDERALDGKLPEPAVEREVSGLQFTGVDQRDDIRALRFRAEASDKDASAGRGALFPTINLVGRIENYDNTDYSLASADGNYREAYDVGLSLKWDILDAATLAKPGLAAARQQLMDSTYKQAVLSAPTDFELWKRRYLYSTNLYQARIRDIQRADESLRIITVAFRQGRRIINEVLDAELDLFRARAGAVQSRFEAAEALNRLELAIGRDLK